MRERERVRERERGRETERDERERQKEYIPYHKSTGTYIIQLLPLLNWKPGNVR